MKILICDPCKLEDNKVTETRRQLKVKGKSFLNIDVCTSHGEEIGKLSFADFESRVLAMHGQSQLVSSTKVERLL